MATQSNWRFCQKCHVMFFAGYGGRSLAGGSRCRARLQLCAAVWHGRQRDRAGQLAILSAVQRHVLGRLRRRQLPCGAAHSPQGFNFILTHDTAGGPSSQSNWKFCQKCNALFFNGYNGGTCPKGGRHAAQGFDFVLPYNADAAAQSGARRPPSASGTASGSPHCPTTRSPPSPTASSPAPAADFRRTRSGRTNSRPRSRTIPSASSGGTRSAYSPGCSRG